MGISKNDKCFAEALAMYQEEAYTRGVETQKIWFMDLQNGWMQLPADKNIYWLRGAIDRTWRILERGEDLRASGQLNPLYYRQPDMTITMDDGRSIVVDNKFTNAEGRIDPWNRAPGKGGTLQRDDYNGINASQGVNGQDLALNKDVCN